MAFKKKSSHKKIYFAIILLVVLIAASVAAIMAMQPSNKLVVGVHVGDTFTYEIRGFSNLSSIGAVETAGFAHLNDTDYYKVSITKVNGTSVSLDTVWRFKDGTQTTGQQTIDLSNGLKTDDKNGFWAIYAGNLKVGDKLRPTSADTVVVNASDTMDYADSSRVRNYMSIGGESQLATDPTKSTLRYDSILVYFDKQTGMLESMIWITDYNNPLMREVTTWTLVDTSVWAVQ